jgi:hypothetical protein
VGTNREGHALHHCSCERTPVMTDRQADRRAAQRRIVAFAIAEDRDEREAVGPWRDCRRFTIELLEIRRAETPAATAVRQCCEPVECLTRGVDADLGHITLGIDRARVVGHRQIRGRLADHGVDARGTSRHLAHGTGRRDTGAECAGDAVAGTRDHRNRRRQSEATHERGPERAHDAPRRIRNRQLGHLETHVLNEPPSPPPFAEIEQRACCGHRPVGDGFAGERQRNELGWLHEQPGRSEDVRLVGANPENLRGHVKSGRHVTGQRMQRFRAERRVERLGFRDGAVVAIDEPRTERCAVLVEWDD